MTADNTVCYLITRKTAELCHTVKETTDMIPTPEKRIAEFENMGFGMFIHYGLYSQLGQGEWIMDSAKMSREEYAKLADTFTAADCKIQFFMTVKLPIMVQGRAISRKKIIFYPFYYYFCGLKFLKSEKWL